MPFTVQNTDFVIGSNMNIELYPKQLQNKNLFLSSAEGIDSELFDQYKLAYNKMLLGDPNYFVCDIDCTFSLHPFLNGHPTSPLVTQQTIDDAMATNPYRANREYYNIFDNDGGEDVFVKRSTIRRYSKPFYPELEGEFGRKYIISYDPSTKLDNSIIMIAELYRDETRGLMVRFLNCRNLIEEVNGNKMVIQKPQQIEILKQIILDYNKGAEDYENLEMLILDAGAGGYIVATL